MAEQDRVRRDRPKRPRRIAWTLLGGSLKLLVSAAIIAAAVALYRYQMKTSPRAGRQKPPTQAKLVQIIPVHREDCATTVTGDGPVIPAQQVTLRPQVTGQIVEIAAEVVPGGFVQAGQKLISIDDRDYRILVEQRRGDLARAVKDLKVEQGNQAIARQEYELLGEVIADEDRELVLREPQLASAQAARESAEAALEKARLDLARCEIRAAFNAIVQEKHVDLGATVSPSSSLVTLIGTDEAWADVKVEIDELQWLDIPRNNGDVGAGATLSNALAWGQGRVRTGRVLSLVGELETQGRMARLLVAVQDPFCLEPENRDKPQLLIGSYVHAVIPGRTLASVFPVDRSHYRDNHTVWIMDDADQLEIRPVEVAFPGPERVYVGQGLTENDRLVVTDIAAPVAGMPLRLADTEDRPSAPPRAEDGDRSVPAQAKGSVPTGGGPR